MHTTRLSTKGQVIIPQNLCKSHGWKPGLKFVVIDKGEGVFLKPASIFKPTTIEEVAGFLKYKGPRKSLKDMEKAIEKGAKERK